MIARGSHSHRALNVFANICIYLALIVSVCQAQTFVGTWTDTIEGGGYGGDLHICQEGDKLYGAYSEVGIVYGTVVGNTVTGFWIEGGAGVRDCAHGTFVWTLADTSRYFVGYYTCGYVDDDIRSQYEWAAARTGIAPPSIDKCAHLAEEGDIQGGWLSTSNDAARSVCARSEHNYLSSYFYNGRYRQEDGFEQGRFGPLGTNIGSGFNKEQDKHGISLLFVLRDGTLGEFYWFALQGNSPDPRDYDDPRQHQYRLWSKSGSDVSEQDCLANQNVVYGNEHPYLDDDDISRYQSSEDSAATSLMASSSSYHSLTVLALVLVLLSSFIYFV